MITRYVRALGYAIVLVIVLFWNLSATARAETLVYTNTISSLPIKWPSSTAVTFPRFDPTIGILTKVEMTATGSISGTVGYENEDVENGVNLGIDVIATLYFTQPNNLPLTVGGNIASFADLLQSYDNTTDFGGTSGVTHPFVADRTSTVIHTTPSALTPFIGIGNITIPSDSAASFVANGQTGNITFRLRTRAKATVVLRYTYAIPQIAIKKFTNGFDADNPNNSDVPRLNPGDVVVWTYLVTNTGSISIPVGSVSVSDSQAGVTPQLVAGSDTNVVGQLEPGETWSYVTPAFVAENLVTPTIPVTIVPGCNPGGAAAPGNRPTYRNIGTVVVPGDSASDPSHYCNPPQPGIIIQKLTNGFDGDGPNDSDVPQILPGTQVIWTYLVTNTGNITFAQASVIVTDDQPGVIPALDPTSDANSDGLLSPGERWRYTATGTAANLLLPPVSITVVAGCNPSESTAPGSRNTYANIGTVSAPGVTASDPSHYCNPPAPGITIRKLTNGFDANTPNGSDVPQIQPGAAVTWTYLVTNTGNITFAQASVVVVDNQSGVTPLLVASSDVGGDGLLAPGEQWRYIANGTAANLAAPATPITRVPGCNPGGGAAPGNRPTYRNIGTVTVPGATATDPSHYCNPAQPGIVIKKATNGADADDPNGNDVPRILPGFGVTWTYVITNTGNVTFTVAQVVVTDSHASVLPQRQTSSDQNGDGLLVPGESWRYVAFGTAVDVTEQVGGVTFTEGCQLTVPPYNNAYQNTGRVSVPGADDTDPSHYCNPIPTGLLPDGSEPTVRFFLAFIRR